ncbi:hypothetical protein U9M48_021420 [Paspalum notatum var. saurae]|uniref:Uncharacterized protein n=1 Tax=Paspalum notatum var. saurae TaxID=547442 RepID=A0AAQ3WTZ3_PASNO
MTSTVARIFNVRRGVVTDIWTKVKKCRAAGVPVDIKSKKAKNCGRKRVDIDLEPVKTVPLNERQTIRALAGVLHVSKSKLHSAFKEGLLRCHSSSLKPYLKDANKKQRLQFCNLNLCTQPKFKDMRNIVHSVPGHGPPEKWFNATKRTKGFYMHPDEEDPHRTRLPPLLRKQAWIKNAETIDELVSNVEKAFHDYSLEDLQRIFLTLQGCFIETMKDGGGNHYKTTHEQIPIREAWHAAH